MENEEILINDTEPTEEPTPEPFVIPYVYNYSAETKEYIGQQQADKDPAESLAKGKFIPLVPANATLLEPPTVEENQIQIYSKTIETHQEPYEVIDPETGESHTEYKTVTTVIENWNIEADYRKNFVKVDNDLNVSEIDTIGEQTGYIVVTKEIGEEITQKPDMFKIVEGEVVKKSQEEYESEQLAKLKSLKSLENTQKAKQAVEQGYVEFKDAQFETNVQTVGDLTATMLLMSQTGLETYEWLSRDDKAVELTLEDFGTLGCLIAGFKNAVWNGRYLAYKTAIESAKTLEDIEKVVIDYDNIGENLS